MFIPTNRSNRIIAGLLIMLAQFSLRGQEMNQVPIKIQPNSIASFENGNYRSALAGFRMLMEREPEIAMHRYYSGICLVELNEKLDEAIELLYSVARHGVPSDVYYYLGMAYHRDYNFSNAQKYYSRFEADASRQELKEHNVKHMISTCRSAKEITASYNPFEVMNITFLDLLDSVQFSQVKMKGGQLQRKPAAYFRMDEDREDLNSLMFMPSDPVKGDYIYYSGYNRSGKGGAQLYRVRKGSVRAWGEPEEISDLNSDGDEILPYFDPIENDLYFASDGRLGIGGFDLYRSHFDSDRDQWSEPINMGFPINSVMDEYLLLPGSDLGMVMFFSTRQGTDSTVTVYRVHLVEPKKKTAANDNRMLKGIASLGGAAGEILADIQSISDDRGSSGSKAESPVSEGNPEQAEQKVITPVTMVKQADKLSEYQVLLAEALEHQALSDSLKDLATSARIRVRESDDPNDRWVWQKQIMVWEKKANDEEEIADGLYAKLNEESVVPSPKPSVNVPETIRVDTVMGELTVYQYTGNDTRIDGEPGTQPAPVSETTSINRFDILSHPPYTRANPIPMDVSLPGGVYYRIQLGAFGMEVEPDAFGGISPVTGERIKDRGLIKYYAGKFSRYAAASMALSRIRSGGYQDAFIVAWYNGNPVSTQKAKQLE